MKPAQRTQLAVRSSAARRAANVTRRAALQRVVAGAGAALAAGAAVDPSLAWEQPAVNEESHPFIDAHSHIWTRDVKAYPLAPGATLDDLAPPSFTAEELLETCRPLGVGRVVLIAHHKFYADDNSYMTDAAKKHPGVFRVVAMIDHRRDGVAERMRRLARQHVSGYRIISSLGKDRWLDEPGMQAMWKTAPETGQSICCLMEPEYLPRLSKMCEQYPETSVVIDHFARIGIDGMIRERDVEKLAALAKRKNVTVKLSAYYALGEKKPPYDYLTPMIRRLLDAYGSERLMWASDAPYQMTGGNTYADSLRYVREGLDFLSEEDRRHLLTGTAQRVFFGELRG